MRVWKLSYKIIWKDCLYVKEKYVCKIYGLANKIVVRFYITRRCRSWGERLKFLSLQQIRLNKV
jgi:hypothetical protein